MEKRKKSIAANFIKGFAVGASMLVPGVSGGTMAIILGIYDDLIHAVSSLRRDMKENLLLLSTFTLAGILGILTFSGPMLTALALWNKPMLLLFTGAILGSIPPLYRKVRISRIKPINLMFAFIGAVLGVCTRYLPEGVFQVGSGLHPYSIIMLVLAGFIIAVALILPGISASYILLMLGMYDLTLSAVKKLDLLYLIPLATGVVAGIFLTAGLLEREMKRHPQFTYMLIIGFMLGSLAQVFPGMPASAEILPCILTFIAGLSAVLWIGRKRTY